MNLDQFNLTAIVIDKIQQEGKLLKYNMLPWVFEVRFPNMS